MKELSLILIAVVASVGASVIVTKMQGGGEVQGHEEDPQELLQTIERLNVTLSSLQEEQRSLEQSVADLRLSPAAGPGSAGRVPVDELDQAIARWMEENAGLLAAAAGEAGQLGAPVDPDDPYGIATMAIDDVIDLLVNQHAFDEGSEEIWKRISAAGRIDEVIAAFEELAENDPTNPDLQVAAGGAYLRKIFEVGSGPAAGELAMKADAAFDRALELDDTHWDARFTKAVSLSNWPAFLGKSGEAIRQFEILIEQQSKQPSKSSHAQSYLFLGNMYQQNGETAAALQAWRDGLALFPDNTELQRQVEVNSR